MKLSVIIPSYNEELSIEDTILKIYDELFRNNINHEIIIINDNSTDNTISIVNNLCSTIDTLSIINNQYENGFGNAVKFGLDNWNGDIVAIMMADLSDSPKDLVLFYNTLLIDNVDCIFGSRFIEGGEVHNYPLIKLIVNRLFNYFLMIISLERYNDFTNAFKMYKRNVIEEIKPLNSSNFSLTIELSLKVISHGFTYKVIPNSWDQRKLGHSKLNLLKNAPQYIHIVYKYIFNKL